MVLLAVGHSDAQAMVFLGPIFVRVGDGGSIKSLARFL